MKKNSKIILVAVVAAVLLGVLVYSVSKVWDRESKREVTLSHYDDEPFGRAIFDDVMSKSLKNGYEYRSVRTVYDYNYLDEVHKTLKDSGKIRSKDKLTCIVDANSGLPYIEDSIGYDFVEKGNVLVVLGDCRVGIYENKSLRGSWKMETTRHYYNEAQDLIEEIEKDSVKYTDVTIRTAEGKRVKVSVPSCFDVARFSYGIKKYEDDSDDENDDDVIKEVDLQSMDEDTASELAEVADAENVEDEQYLSSVSKVLSDTAAPYSKAVDDSVLIYSKAADDSVLMKQMEAAVLSDTLVEESDYYYEVYSGVMVEDKDGRRWMFRRKDISNADVEVIAYSGTNPVAFRVRMGKGYAYYLPNKLFFSNYGVMNCDKRFLEEIMSYVDGNYVVRLDVKIESGPAKKDPSLSYLTEQEALDLAYWLAVISILLFLIFAARRKQNVIPEVTAPRNRTVDLVRHEGTLYQSQGDYLDLVQKKIVYFFSMIDHLLHVKLNEELTAEKVARVALNAKMDTEKLRAFIELLYDVRDGKKAVDAHDMKELIDGMNDIIYRINGERKRL
ncbi:MAG: hypothetical protein II221_02510 [Paludibacteraceae bacterium]|nr:hypothetical protein [Paludibacteraceae bacterium]